MANTSSTSPLSNSQKKAKIASLILLASLLIILAIIELVTRPLLPSVSSTFNRIESELSKAELITAGSKEKLLVGNSLVLEGVDVLALNDYLKPSSVQRFVIEQTNFYDWYFGLKRILTEGSRPDAIIVGMEPRHLLSSSARGEIFSRFLLTTSDYLNAILKLKLHPTEASKLLLAHYSAFYSAREEIRKNIVTRIIPDLPNLFQIITNTPKPPASLADLASLGKDRLTEFRKLSETYSVPIVFLSMPPTSMEQASLLKALGNEVGLKVLSPLSETAQISRSDFSTDGYHLGPNGRKKFTAALAEQIR